MIPTDRSLDGRLLQQLVHLPRRTDQLAGGVGVKHKVENNDHQDERVAVVAKKRGAQPAQDHVRTHADRDEENGRVDVHARQRGHDGATAEQQLRADEDVGHKRKEHEDEVGRRAVARVHYLEICVAPRRIHLGLARQHGEHENLHRRSRRIPERPCR